MEESLISLSGTQRLTVSILVWQVFILKALNMIGHQDYVVWSREFLSLDDINSEKSQSNKIDC